ncbi:hypothetical protein MPH_13818 [Macrophomina phaseolina MS6]|uniref:Uncharacterized protein n=1 Tax=Macrophomina phaseolina (strain MS6) TaxID=1126212 RepID=K2RXN3_MACPH|nr:hypothetical protein MPH_13818 [Macrophomina phaseolina MS6]
MQTERAAREVDTVASHCSMEHCGWTEQRTLLLVSTMQAKPEYRQMPRPTSTAALEKSFTADKSEEGFVRCPQNTRRQQVLARQTSTTEGHVQLVSAESCYRGQQSIWNRTLIRTGKFLIVQSSKSRDLPNLIMRHSQSCEPS